MLREQVVQVVRERMKAGASLSGLSRELGISWLTLRNWLDSSKPTASPRHLVPVRLVEEPENDHNPSSESVERWLSLVTPNGYRLDHLTLDEAIELVERLG